MRYTQLQTPRGVRDFPPREAAQKRAVEERLRRTFSAWGYQEVITPTVEFFEALALGDGPDLADKMYKFFDREGNLLALRPEMTTPIGRLVATRLKDAPKPLRLFYLGNVFRYEEPQAGRSREFCQAGVELVGTTSPGADAEVVALALDALEACGLKGFRVDVGQIDYFHGLLADLGLEGEARRAIRQALLRRDYVALDEAIQRAELTEKGRHALRRLPRLRGDLEVLQEARSLTDHPRAQAALDSLRSVFDVLKDYGVADRVYVDLGMIKDLDYYTGMVLEGYSEVLGFPLCTGGRYDNLIGRFGYACPATGFALSVERLLAALAHQQGREGVAGSILGSEPVARWVVAAANEPARSRALQAVRRLRQAGEPVEVDLEPRSPQDLQRYAALKGIAAVVWFPEEGGPRVTAPPQLLELWYRLVGE